MTWRPEDEEVQYDPFGGAMYYDREANPISFRDWAENRQTQEMKRVALTFIGEVSVSTVWIGINHSWHPDSPPLIFETMVFGGKLNQEMNRYTTEEQARQGHADMVKRVEEAEATA